MPLNWTLNNFDSLSVQELYALLKLRNEVFVVEQNCVYQDADGEDPLSWHLCGWDGYQLAAYCRIIPPEISYPEASIGRVVTAMNYRKAGIGIELMKQAIENTCSLFNTDTISIGAQCYLEKFYTSLGFHPGGPEYLEDGIPHIHMIFKK